jgi:hypothetical protein
MPPELVQGVEMSGVVDVSTGGAAGRVITADSPAASQDTKLKAKIAVPPAMFTSTVKFDAQEQQQMRVYGTPKDVILFEIQAAMDRILIDYSTALYAGNATPLVFGLNDIANQNPATAYAGLLPTTYPSWVAPSISATTGYTVAGKMEVKMFDDLEALLATAGGTADALAMTPAQVNRYKAIFRLNNNNYNLPPGTADVGYSGYDYEGRPIIRDRFASPNTIYFVNRDKIRIGCGALAENETRRAVNYMGFTFYIGDISQANAFADAFEVALVPIVFTNDRRSVATLTGVTS